MLDAFDMTSNTLQDVGLTSLGTLRGIRDACSVAISTVEILIKDLSITLDADLKSIQQMAVEDPPTNSGYYMSSDEFHCDYVGFSDIELNAIKDHYFLNPDCMASRAFCYTKDFDLLVCPRELMRYISEYYNNKQLITRLEKLNFYNIDLYNDRDKRKTDTGLGEKP